jgi:aryl-alcohol dehydrogenase-like predicted oxidoreductase
VEYGTIPGLDKKVSRIVQGTVMLNSEDPEPGYALLDGVYEAGCTAFDTARHYGGGIEIVFGQWVRDRGVRDEVMLIGKGAHHSPERRRVTPQDIADDLEISLGQFGLDYIDLYLLHRDDPEVPVGPIVEALAGHQKAGKIGAYGGSNWSHTRIAEANDYAAANGLAPFVASSPNYSLAVWTEPPWPECVTLSGPDGKEARAWYAEQKMPVIPWSSLAGGFFSGRFRRDNLDTFTNYYDLVCARSFGVEDNFKRLDRAEELAKERGMTTAQIAMAYILNQPVDVFPLVGCRTPAEFAENAAALGTKLTPAEVAWLDLETDEKPGA